MHAPLDARPAYHRHQLPDASLIEKVAAGILALLIAVPSPLSVNLSLGGLISLGLSPVAFPVLWRNTHGRWLLIAALGLVPLGWLVAQTSLLQDHGRTFSTQLLLYQAALPVGLIASVAGAYWCITRLGLQRFLLLSYAGLLAALPLTYHQNNLWKYGLALPISILAIILFARNRLLLGLTLTLLATVSIAADFRSWTAFLFMTAAVAVFADRRSTTLSASKVGAFGIVVLAAGVATAWLIIEAATAGILGDTVQQRTTKQLQVSNGNLILGGRPEWGAATALWRENPLGIGIGVTPSSGDYWLAIRSMPLGSEGLQDISNVAKSFQQGQVNFHSTLWTFWAVYGVAGMIFAMLALIYCTRATLLVMARLSRPNLQAAVILLMLSSVWDILFSPTITAQLAIALATATHVLSNSVNEPIQTKDSRT